MSILGNNCAIMGFDSGNYHIFMAMVTFECGSESLYTTKKFHYIYASFSTEILKP